jgi:hypothetical protein
MVDGHISLLEAVSEHERAKRRLVRTVTSNYACPIWLQNGHIYRHVQRYVVQCTTLPRLSTISKEYSTQRSNYCAIRIAD